MATEQDKNEFYKKRFNQSIRAAVISTALALVIALLFLPDESQTSIPFIVNKQPSSYPIAEAGSLILTGRMLEDEALLIDEKITVEPGIITLNFSWVTNEHFPCQDEAAVTNTEPCTVQVVYSVLLARAAAEFWSIVHAPQQMNLVWLIRLQLMVALPIFIFLSFRNLLPESYDADEKVTRHKIAKHILDKRWSRPLWQQFDKLILTQLPILFLIYILSEIASTSLADMFTGLTFNFWQAILVSLICSFGVTYALVNWLSAANTRDVLTLCLLVIVAGLARSFVIAEDDWWIHAISRTGIDTHAAPFLSFTLICTSLVLVLLWFDISNIFAVLFANFKNRDNGNISKSAMPSMATISSLFLASLLLIAFVGIFPNVEGVRWINSLHLMGAYGSAGAIIVIGKVWFTFFVARHLLPRHILMMTGALLVGDVLCSIFFFVGRMSNCPACYVNLTAYELWIIGSIGIWLYSLTAIALEKLDVIEGELDFGMLDTMLERGNGGAFIRSLGYVIVIGFATVAVTFLVQLISG